MNKKTTILFDFDGTLADSLHRLLDISNSFADEYGYRKVKQEEIPYFRTKSTLETFRELKIPLLKVPVIARRVKKTFQREAHLSQPFAGMYQVLNQLSEKYALGILTSNSQPNVHKFLVQHDLAIFAFIYTSSNIFGKSSVLKRIVRERNLELNYIIYVGDEMRDIEAARQTGIEVVAVSWGANTKKALAALRPTYLVDKPSELLSLLA